MELEKWKCLMMRLFIWICNKYCLLVNWFDQIVVHLLTLITNLGSLESLESAESVSVDDAFLIYSFSSFSSSLLFSSSTLINLHALSPTIIITINTHLQSGNSFFSLLFSSAVHSPANHWTQLLIIILFIIFLFLSFIIIPPHNSFHVTRITKLLHFPANLLTLPNITWYKSWPILHAMIMLANHKLPIQDLNCSDYLFHEESFEL